MTKPLSVRQEVHFTHRETRKVQRRRNKDDQTISTTLTINSNPIFNLTCENSIMFLFSLKTNVLGNNANIQMIRLDSRNIDSITILYSFYSCFVQISIQYLCSFSRGVSTLWYIPVDSCVHILNTNILCKDND